MSYDALRSFNDGSDDLVETYSDRALERVWLVEHPPLYTAGTSAKAADLVAPERFPVHRTGRGGQYTYHGPGQRVAYVMLDLNRRRPDLRAYVAALEAWLIATLEAYTVRGERREDRVGVWVRRPEKGPGVEDKIAAIGIRVAEGVTMHGFALNCDNDLAYFDRIVPCGIRDASVTSLTWELGRPVSVTEVLPIVTVLPILTRDGDKRTLQIPAEAGYDGTVFEFTGS